MSGSREKECPVKGVLGFESGSGLERCGGNSRFPVSQVARDVGNRDPMVRKKQSLQAAEIPSYIRWRFQAQKWDSRKRQLETTNKQPPGACTQKPTTHLVPTFSFRIFYLLCNFALLVGQILLHKAPHFCL